MNSEPSHKVNFTLTVLHDPLSRQAHLLRAGDVTVDIAVLALADGLFVSNKLTGTLRIMLEDLAREIVEV